MERKREKTETVGTGFGIVAAVEGTRCGCSCGACDGLMAAAVVAVKNYFPIGGAQTRV